MKPGGSELFEDYYIQSQNNLTPCRRPIDGPSHWGSRPESRGTGGGKLGGLIPRPGFWLLHYFACFVTDCPTWDVVTWKIEQNRSQRSKMMAGGKSATATQKRKTQTHTKMDREEGDKRNRNTGGRQRPRRGGGRLWIRVSIKLRGDGRKMGVMKKINNAFLKNALVGGGSQWTPPPHPRPLRRGGGGGAGVVPTFKRSIKKEKEA